MALNWLIIHMVSVSLSTWLSTPKFTRYCFWNSLLTAQRPERLSGATACALNQSVNGPRKKRKALFTCTFLQMASLGGKDLPDQKLREVHGNFPHKTTTNRRSRWVPVNPNMDNPRGSRILVRGAQRSFNPRGALSPKLPENCMILKKYWGQGARAPRAPRAPWIC